MQVGKGFDFMKPKKYLRLFSLVTIVIIGSLFLAGCAPTIDELIDKRDVPGLIKAMNNKNEEVRASAATALGDFGWSKATEPLIKALEDKSEKVRSNAEAALVKLGDYAIDQLLIVMEKGTSISPVAQRILEKITLNLIQELNSNDTSDKVKNAKASLLRIGTMAVDPLIEAVGNDDFGTWMIAWNAADVLGDIGDPRSIDALILALNRDGLVVNTAAKALKKMSDDAYEPLLEALKKESGAFYGLMRMGRPGTEPALIKALNDYGDKEMAEFYLSSKNELLEKAAKDWATHNGYVIRYGIPSSGIYWGY